MKRQQKTWNSRTFSTGIVSGKEYTADLGMWQHGLNMKSVKKEQNNKTDSGRPLSPSRYLSGTESPLLLRGTRF
jgi:hypothetical protein